MCNITITLFVAWKKESLPKISTFFVLSKIDYFKPLSCVLSVCVCVCVCV